jgi:hypothetical protein
MTNTNINRERQWDYVNNHFHTCGSITTATPNGTDIYTPPTGYKFVVTDILITCENNNFIRISEDGNGQCANIAQFTVDTTGNSGVNFSHSFRTPYFSRKVDNPLRMSTTTSADVFYSILGYIIKD